MEFASYGSIPEEFADANTWLISAAPDLLAMCEEIYEHREDYPGPLFWSRIQSLIAKAKGETE
jgi:hypothetical protein